MKVIYKPRGRAREYSELAVNLYSGCDHRCIYCYSPRMLHKTKNSFSQSAPREGIIQLITNDAIEMREHNDHRNVLMCFTCDPYQYINDWHQLTRQAIWVFNKNNINFTILTKGGNRSLPDLGLIASCGLGTYAVTLTLIDETMRMQYEPNAAPTNERIDVLKIAHEMGIPTWVSLEPVIDPDQTIELIKETNQFVDMFKVGKLNYLDEAKKIDWSKFANDVVSVLEDVGSKYYIKEDLRKFI